MNTLFSDIASKYQEKILKTASELIRIPSYSLQEREIANYVVDLMTALGYDRVVRDPYGNVFGVLYGTGGGASVTLNCHMDVVHEGDPSDWVYPPYGGVVAEGRLWGRGASDTKGTMAIQIFAPIMLREAGLLPKGDIVTACVVAEESPGYGTQMQCRDKTLLTNYAVMGEATENDIAIACRGRCCIRITIQGTACHAAAVHGATVFDYIERLLPAIKGIEPAQDDLLGSSCLNITKIESSEPGTNVVPASVSVYCDYRQVGEDTHPRVLEKFRRVLDEIQVPGIRAEVSVLEIPVQTYTGVKGSGVEGEPPFSADRDAPYILRAKQAVESAVGHPIRVKVWPFATDAGHYAAAGVKVLGYSPAEVACCHTNRDSISVAAVAEGTIGYLSLIHELANQEESKQMI